MGAIKLDRLIREIPGFPPKLANEVKHCMLAHHGELEFGSPKKPALLGNICRNHGETERRSGMVRIPASPRHKNP